MSKYYKKLQIYFFFINIYELCIYVLFKKKKSFFFLWLSLLAPTSNFDKKKWFFYLDAVHPLTKEKKNEYEQGPPSPRGENKLQPVYPKKKIIRVHPPKKNTGVEATLHSKKNKKVYFYVLFFFVFLSDVCLCLVIGTPPSKKKFFPPLCAKKKK
ncbi:hypothetical protein RFI_06205 [Reticulomyxa filosa]|uniref:Uncharacterized protein n=1 Tax=Reticulomyxa filosa TaxID=46433 RepID=X6NYK7_RETFI|nr:hypothetical protein RFI_06205 [Reticulomyxa filosa]|eukprot:ETO30914.1 hypothetical protein RFI_06205 [Reticulomyxa filosa]